ncbi:HD domain-containing protein [Kamptonema cortianum]|nr:HD domain-containing protein [Geitlerinema splendidum]MDK3156911.1 HD domain-containing protein [Kamptonema cortianum]
MVEAGTNVVRRNVGILAFFGTSIVGLLILAFVFDGAKSTFVEQKQSALLLASELVASQVDAVKLDRIPGAESNNSQTYRDIEQRIRHSAIVLPELSNISIVRKEPAGWITLFTVSKNGKAKAQYLEPVNEIPSDVDHLWNNSAPKVTPVVREDRWGEWFSSFASIRNLDGVTSAIVVVDTPSAYVHDGIKQIEFSFLIAAISFVLFAAFIGWVITGLVSTDLDHSAGGRRIRKGVMEIILVTAILGMVCKGAMEVAEQTYEREKLTATYSNLKSMLAETQNIDGSAQHLLQDLASYVEEELSETSFLWVMIGLSIPSLIGLLAAVRIAIRKETDYIDVKSVSDRAQTDYARLLEYLPIGVFAWRDGICTFGNAEWERQVSYTDGQDRRDAFEFSLHPEDREHTLKAIDRAVQAELPFNVQYRVVTPNGVRYFESHGAPIYDASGTYSHSLAFSMDTTARTSTQIALKDAYKNVEEKNALLSSALTELEDNLENVVRSLVKAVEAKDPYTAGHSERVMRYSVMLGQAIGLGPYEMRILELGTLVHDIGKIGIPDEILTKPGRLTDDEFELIKKHPEFGENIIGNIDLFKTCLPIVRWHHERLNGTGYPDQLSGDEIPLLVRISSIADMFDAMTSTRAYRSGMPKERVLEIMQECVEKGELDAHLFAIFCHVVQEQGVIPQDTATLQDEVA